MTGSVATTTGTMSTGITATPTVIAPATSTDITALLKSIETTYGAHPAGFITRIIGEWDKIREAYKMPETAFIGGYEFVQTGANDHVFVDIIYTGTTLSGSYDAKLLYQFDKTNYARKLVGFFEFNPATGYYITRTGSNPFSNAKRVFVSDPRIRYAMVPNTATLPAGSTGTSTTVTPVTTPPVPATNNGTVTIQDIKNAYAAERYLSAINLSDTWLTSNAPTLEVLQIRYRVYFAIAKYAEALKEIEKVKSIGQLSSSVACEAYVIASYANNTSLMNSYKPLCK